MPSGGRSGHPVDQVEIECATKPLVGNSAVVVAVGDDDLPVPQRRDDHLRVGLCAICLEKERLRPWNRGSTFLKEQSP